MDTYGRHPSVLSRASFSAPYNTIPRTTPLTSGHRENELTAKRKGGYENEPDTKDDQTAFLVNCDFSGRPYSRDEQRCGRRDEVRRPIGVRHLRHCARPKGKDLSGGWWAGGNRRAKPDPARGCIAIYDRRLYRQRQSSRGWRENRQPSEYSDDNHSRERVHHWGDRGGSSGRHDYRRQPQHQ